MPVGHIPHRQSTREARRPKNGDGRNLQERHELHTQGVSMDPSRTPGQATNRRWSSGPNRTDASLARLTDLLAEVEAQEAAEAALRSPTPDERCALMATLEELRQRTGRVRRCKANGTGDVSQADGSFASTPLGAVLLRVALDIEEHERRSAADTTDARSGRTTEKVRRLTGSRK